MKNIKKAFALLMATTMATSLFLTACEDNGGETPTPDGTQTTSEYLLKGGVSSYKIVLPDDADSDELLAGERLQSLFKEATNTLLPIVQDSEISAIGSDDKYILIGDNDFAVANNMVPTQTAVKSTGYTIKTKDKCIYIAGGKSVGTLFGVYNFLGRILNYDYFAEDIYSLDKGVRELSLQNYDVTVIPDCEFNMLTNAFLTPAKLKNFSMYSESYTPVRGATGHGSIYYTLDDENDSTIANAIKNNPKWFRVNTNVSEEDENVNDDVYKKTTQLCYTAHGDSVEYEKLYNRMAQNIIAVMKENENAVRFNCSVSDNHDNCNCDEGCKAENEKYGTPAGALVKLLNKVIETVDAWMLTEEGKTYAREWNVDFYAYNNYEVAPAKLVNGNYEPIDESVRLNKRLVPVVAYVNADYTSPIEASQNKPYKEQCDAWRNISNTAKMYVYAQNYNYYLLPYNMFGVMSNQYKYWKGCTIYLLTNNNGFGTGFDNLRIYLASKLGIDVNANVEELIQKYFANVYLDAGDVMYNLFNKYRTNEQRLKEKYPNDFCATTSCYQKRWVNSKYYEATLLDSWRNDIQTAIDTIEYLKDEDMNRYNRVYKMIVGERVWINNLYYLTNKDNVLYETIEDVVNTLTQDIEFLGIAYTKEGPYVTTATFITEMKAYLEGRAK